MTKKILLIYYLIVLFIAALFYSCNNAPEKKIKIYPNDFPYEILEEKNIIEPSLNNFLNYPQKFKFKYLAKGEGIAMQKNKSYWIRFKINPNTENTNWILESNNFMHFCIYNPLKDGSYLKECHHPSTSISERSIFSFKNIFLVEPNTKNWYYGEVKSDINMGLGFSIFTIKEFIFYFSIENMFLITLLSLMLFLSLITILLFIRLRQLVFAYYFFFLVSSLLYYLVYVGLFHPFFGIQKVNYIHYTIFYAFITISFLMYSKEFLTVKDIQITGINFIPKLVLARVIILILSIWEQLHILRSSTIDFILISFCVIPAYYAVKTGLKSGYLYFISLSIVLLSFFAQSTIQDNSWPDLFPYYIIRILINGASYMQLFMFLEILFFTYALIERYVEIKKQNEDKTINALKVQKFINEEMSFIVKVRTKELEIANQQLKENSLIIAEMNKLLIDDNESLIRDVELLKKARFIDQNLNYAEFKNTFQSDEIAYEFLAQLKWKNGYCCKKCNYKKYYIIEHMSSRKCKICGYTESSILDTILDNIHFSAAKALYIVYVTYHLRKINLTAISKEIELRTATCSAFHKKVVASIESKKQKTVSENENSWVNVLL